MAEKTTIGQNIKAILNILEWSQTDLAVKLNTTQPTVSKWLDGEIDDEKLNNISAVLGISVEFIRKFKPRENKNVSFHQENHKDVKVQGYVDSYVDGNLDEFIVLEKEKQILLIESHIGQLRILGKMNNCNEADVQEINTQIEENRKKIEALQNDIARYRNNK